MRILFLGDVVGLSGCKAIKKYLPQQIKKRKIDFVIVNGENAAKNGLGITNEIAIRLFNCGVNVITSGNHIWEQKETLTFIKKKTDYYDHIILFHLYQEKASIYIN